MANSNATTVADFSATLVDIQVTEKTSPVIPVTVTDSNGAAIDITGGTFLMRVNTEPDGSGTELFTVAGVLSVPLSGIVTFQPSVPNLTQTVRTYYYEVNMVLAPEDRDILYGRFIICQGLN
jgi:hypothetical protein